MKFNRRGQAAWSSAAGVGVDQTTIVSEPAGAGTACWVDDDTVAGNLSNSAGQYYLSTVPVTGGSVSPIDAEATNRARAGGGFIAAFPGSHDPGGVRIYRHGALALRVDGDDIGDVSPEGIVATQVGYSGYGIRCYVDLAMTLVLSTGQIYFDAASGTWCIRVRGDVVDWVEIGVGTRLASVSTGVLLPVAARTEAVAQSVPVPLPNGTVILIEVTGRVTARFSGRTTGVVLDSAGDTYAMDAVLLPDGATVRVGWSTSAGESAGSIQTIDVTVGAVDASTTDLNSEVITPPNIPAFPEPAILAPYPLANGETTTHCAGENSYLSYPPEAPSGLYETVTADLIRPVVDTEQGGVPTGNEDIVTCTFDTVTSVAPTLKAWEVLGFQCFPEPGEGLADYRTRCANTVAFLRARGLSALIIACCWNRQGTLTDQEVANGLEAVRDCAGATLGVLFFGLDRGTAEGWFKPLYQSWVDLFRAPAGRPEFPTKPEPPPLPDYTRLLALCAPKGLR